LLRTHGAGVWKIKIFYSENFGTAERQRTLNGNNRIGMTGFRRVMDNQFAVGIAKEGDGGLRLAKRTVNFYFFTVADINTTPDFSSNEKCAAPLREEEFKAEG
jgi:hypothetical protein